MNRYQGEAERSEVPYCDCRRLGGGAAEVCGQLVAPGCWLQEAVDAEEGVYSALQIEDYGWDRDLARHVVELLVFIFTVLWQSTGNVASTMLLRTGVLIEIATR